MKKILFTDLDGTLLNDESKISSNMKAILDQMVEQGHTLVLASGRPLYSILDVKENAGLSYPGIYISANNGSLIYDCDAKKSIFEIRVPLEDVRLVWDLAHSMDIHIQTYTEDTILSSKDDIEIKKYRTRIRLPFILTKDPVPLLKIPPYKLLAIDLNDRDRLVGLSNAIMKKASDRLSTIFSSDQYLEIFSNTAGKGRALLWLCNYLSIPVSDSIACGDSENDLSMLQAAGLSVAMCNGCDLLKESADIITSRSNQEDGLIEIISSYILN